MPTPVVRPAADRFVSRSPGVETRHCFSFGPHYDPAHVGHGALVLHDEHLLAAGAGFGPHPHRDVEVVSWVLEGMLLHEHDGRREQVPAGSLQRLTAGTGVVHAERAGGQATRFVQLWLTCEPGGVPAYEQAVAGTFAEVLPGVLAGRLTGGWTLPEVARAHVYVASGHAALDGLRLGSGDSARLTQGRGQVLHGPAELLVTLLQE